MKKIFLPLFCVVSIASGQYAVKSPYLQQPDLVIGYVDSCAQFWTKAYEPMYGGFYTNVDRTGKVIVSWGTYKNSLNQSRDAYGFLRAFMLTGNEMYLTQARRALDFLYSSAWDTVNGGWYKEITYDGKPNRPADNKTAFYQHYALLGIAASYETTRDTIDRAWLLKGYTINESKFWDSRPQYFGYYDNTKYDCTNPADKSFNATVDAITTHVLHLFLMTGDTVYKNRLLQLADNMINRLAASAEQQKIGFTEIYDAQWNPRATTSDEKRTIMGHVLKTAWCLARLYQLFPDTTYLSTAERLAKMVWDKGYDHLRGGPYKDYDRTTGAMMMYNQDTAKAWWQMEQAITAGLMLYQITGKSYYLQMADESLDFFMKYFVDHTYGDVYSDRLKNGDPIPAWGDYKGNDGKAGYHSIETGYYVYLYMKLLVQHQPATLYYKFTATGTNRVFRMNPISYPNNLFKIKKVTLNDTAYANVDYVNRILTLPSGVGGKFAVTYETLPPTSIASREPVSIPDRFTVEQNYPNPFNPQTAIRYSLNEQRLVTLNVFDALGRTVATLVNQVQSPGVYTVHFDGSSLSSGVYYYSVKAGARREVKKMLLLK